MSDYDGDFGATEGGMHSRRHRYGGALGGGVMGSISSLISGNPITVAIVILILLVAVIWMGIVMIRNRKDSFSLRHGNYAGSAAHLYNSGADLRTANQMGGNTSNWYMGGLTAGGCDQPSADDPYGSGCGGGGSGVNANYIPGVGALRTGTEQPINIGTSYIRAAPGTIVGNQPYSWNGPKYTAQPASYEQSM